MRISDHVRNLFRSTWHLAISEAVEILVRDDLLRDETYCQSDSIEIGS